MTCLNSNIENRKLSGCASLIKFSWMLTSHFSSGLLIKVLHTIMPSLTMHTSIRSILWINSAPDLWVFILVWELWWLVIIYRLLAVAWTHSSTSHGGHIAVYCRRQAHQLMFVTRTHAVWWLSLALMPSDDCHAHSCRLMNVTRTHAVWWLSRALMPSDECNCHSHSFPDGCHSHPCRLMTVTRTHAAWWLSRALMPPDDCHAHPCRMMTVTRTHAVWWLSLAPMPSDDCHAHPCRLMTVTRTHAVCWMLHAPCRVYKLRTQHHKFLRHGESEKQIQGSNQRLIAKNVYLV